jgi:hypothetical protein
VHRQQEVNHEETKALRLEIFGISESNRILSLSLREGLLNSDLAALTQQSIAQQETLTEIAKTLQNIEQRLTPEQPPRFQNQTSLPQELPTLNDSVWR